MSFKESLSRTVATIGFKARKHSPEILIGVGIVGFVGTVVLACKATTKAERILDEHKQDIDIVKETRESYKDAPQVYSEKNYEMDVATVYLKTMTKFVKLYWPAATLGLISVACILKAHGILSERNLALLAAYKSSEEAFLNYRNRVANEIGGDREDMVMHGIHPVEVEETDAKGKTKKRTIEQLDPEVIKSDPERILFDEQNPNWQDDAEANKTFLLSVENWANTVLKSRGHLFLNELRYELGLDPIPEGQLLGWIYSSKPMDGDGDNYVDLGIYQHVGDPTDEGMVKRQFFYGNNPSVMLYLNYDGIIWDKI